MDRPTYHLVATRSGFVTQLFVHMATPPLPSGASYACFPKPHPFTFGPIWTTVDLTSWVNSAERLMSRSNLFRWILKLSNPIFPAPGRSPHLIARISNDCFCILIYVTFALSSNI